jgi:NADH-quinone oxidoreductase subunit A
MLASYLPLFMMLAVAAALALTFFGLTTIFGPSNPSKEKSLPYESGSESVGAKHVRLSVKFYLTAILFVVFDIEAVFLYPWATLFRELGAKGLVEMVVFIGVLGITLLYAWKKGALEWER